MSFQWTPHRFSGGVLALDVANSVVRRFDATRRTDRFAVAEQLAAFSAAASELSGDRSTFGALAPVGPGSKDRLLRLREAIDAHFRHRTIHGNDDAGLLATLLVALAAIFAAYKATSQGVDRTCPVDLATARSALRLIASDDTERLKICPNCEWLFLDRSRNRSRTWCDMAVCGNRAKARLHYRKNRMGTTP